MSFAVLMGASGDALAISAGCQAVNNGQFNIGADNTFGANPPVPTATMSAVFDAGDALTFRLTNNSGTGTFTFTGALAGGGVQTNTTTINFVATAGNGTLTINANLGAQLFVFQASCVPFAAPTGPTGNSQQLRTLQIAGTQIVANQSGAAIVGAVTGAIGDAFSPAGSAPIVGGPSGFTANFAAEPQSAVASRAEDAFAALGYAKAPSYFTKAPPRILPEWTAWLDVRGSGFDRAGNINVNDIRAEQVNVTGGIGRKLTPDFLIGLFAGYEHAGITTTATNGRLTADGGTIGGYAAWRFAPRWRIDALGGFTELNYSASVGNAAGSFSGSRFVGAGGVSGTYEFGGLVLEPSSNIYVLTESERAWTDSLGAIQASRNFTIGRVATGAKLAVLSYAFAGDIRVSPYVGLYGDWRFSSDNALPVAVTLVGFNNGWSGRATGGLAFASSGGARVTLGAEYGGIGAPYKIWTGNVRGTVPF